MNFTLQLHGERIIYQVPPGLYELMSDISREVLRDQPSQLYKYIANYLDTLLKLRAHSRQAMELVDDVLAENKELFTYVDSLGLDWYEANDAARKIQRAYKTYRARVELREKVKTDKERRMKQLLLGDYSESFLNYFDSLGIDFETANRASIVIQSAFRTYMAKQEFKRMSKVSTHTIDAMIPSELYKIPLVLDRPSSTKNKDLLVYQESPVPSIHSGWYKPIEERKSTASIRSSLVLKKSKGERDSEILVYEQSPKPSIASGWYRPQQRSVETDEKQFVGQTLGKPSEMSRSFTEKPSIIIGHEGIVPSYYDKDQSKIPMISETGELALEEEIVTLYSGDSDIKSMGVPDGPYVIGTIVEQRSLSKKSIDIEKRSLTRKSGISVIKSSSDKEFPKEEVGEPMEIKTSKSIHSATSVREHEGGEMNYSRVPSTTQTEKEDDITSRRPSRTPSQKGDDVTYSRRPSMTPSQKGEGTPSRAPSKTLSQKSQDEIKHLGSKSPSIHSDSSRKQSRKATKKSSIKSQVEFKEEE